MSDTSAILPTSQATSSQMTKSGAPQSQWLRKINLTVYNGSTGNGLDLSQMRIKFQVQRTTIQTPNLLVARVYNLARDTQQQAIQEFNRVVLAAGYQTGRYGELFDGTIVQYKRGKETPVDSYLEIVAGDADAPLNYGIVQKTLPAGSTKDEQAKAIAQGFVEQGATLGKIDLGKAGSQKSIRGITLFGMSRDRMRELANSVKADWSVQDGKVISIPREGYLAGEIAVLNPKTGLIGMPELTQQGISARCLLNSALRLGGLVKIETDVISGVPYTPGNIPGSANEGAAVSPTQTDARQGAGGRPPALRNQVIISAATSPTGTYKILLLNHSGDTRQNPWYSDIVCLAYNETTKEIMSVPNDATTRGFKSESDALVGNG